jgi:pilus assembly protein Flp/PilA
LATLSLPLSKTDDARHRASSPAPYGKAVRAAYRRARSLTRVVVMTEFVTRFIRDESGVTSIEYALIAALISVVAIAAMTFAAQQLLAVYNGVGNDLAVAP